MRRGSEASWCKEERENQPDTTQQDLKYILWSSNQDERCTLEPIYTLIFTQHSRSWLLCVPAIEIYFEVCLLARRRYSAYWWPSHYKIHIRFYRVPGIYRTLEVMSSVKKIYEIVTLIRNQMDRAITHEYISFFFFLWSQNGRGSTTTAIGSVPKSNCHWRSVVSKYLGGLRRKTKKSKNHEEVKKATKT